MQTIQVALYEGKIDIQAYVYGGFAVHRKLISGGASKHFWTVTHIASGMQAYPNTRTKKRAAQIARALDAEFPELRTRPTKPSSAKVWARSQDGKRFKAFLGQFIKEDLNT